MTLKPIAEGSGSTDLRTRAAAIRAVDAYCELERVADKLADELDNITMPGYRPYLSDEDSLVIAIKDTIEALDTNHGQ